MTTSEIIGVLGTIGGIVIGASGKYIGNLLNKKKDETIQEYRLNSFEDKVVKMEKRLEEIEKHIQHIPLIELRLKTIEGE